MFCAIWYHFYNLKHVKNTHGGMFLLLKLQASVCKFTKSVTSQISILRKTSHMYLYMWAGEVEVVADPWS